MVVSLGGGHFTVPRFRWCQFCIGNLADWFTHQCGVHTLVWYEVHDRMDSAIVSERAIKE